MTPAERIAMLRRRLPEARTGHAGFGAAEIEWLLDQLVAVEAERDRAKADIVIVGNALESMRQAAERYKAERDRTRDQVAMLVAEFGAGHGEQYYHQDGELAGIDLIEGAGQ